MYNEVLTKDLTQLGDIAENLETDKKLYAEGESVEGIKALPKEL